MRHHEAVADLPALRTLADIVADLDHLDRAGRNSGRPTIFAERPWAPGSPAVVLDEEAHRGRAASMPSYAYLLEVGHAAEVLEVWSSRRAGTTPSAEQAVDALIHYAAHDAHLPTTCAHYGCGRPGAGSCGTCSRTVCARHSSGSVPECPTCSKEPAVLGTGRSNAEVERGGGGRLWGAVLASGVASIGLGTLLQSVGLSVAGICLLVVGGCIWLGAFVLRIMD
jgi:hypothetical protein